LTTLIDVHFERRTGVEFKTRAMAFVGFTLFSAFPLLHTRTIFRLCMHALCSAFARAHSILGGIYFRLPIIAVVAQMVKSFLPCLHRLAFSTTSSSSSSSSSSSFAAWMWLFLVLCCGEAGLRSSEGHRLIGPRSDLPMGLLSLTISPLLTQMA
jgi:hypothetical protein